MVAELGGSLSVRFIDGVEHCTSLLFGHLGPAVQPLGGSDQSRPPAKVGRLGTHGVT